jgi:CRISPR-associated protein Csb1
MTTPSQFTYESLTAAVQNAAAFRCRRRLQPAGGSGDKVFPPTYMGGKYALEERVIGGTRVPCVLLDSVQSQANRMELALLHATRAGDPRIPLVEVDFSKTDVREVGSITSLEAPHRLADAILRDSCLGNEPFRKTEKGRILENAKPARATDLLGICPTALLFGVWDSTGPLGGSGTKFQRIMTSEVFAINGCSGVKPSSRIDPLAIQSNAGPIYEAKTGGWTLIPGEAVLKNGKPILFKDGKPSSANHGNIPPDFNEMSGGITMDYALQTVVISLPALRRLRFPVEGQASSHDLQAQAVLAALGLYAATLSIEAGCDLRSRCLLVPEEEQGGWEVVAGNGEVVPYRLDAQSAGMLLTQAITTAKKLGLPWMEQPLVLQPSASLVALVKKSRDQAKQGKSDDQDGDAK